MAINPKRRRAHRCKFCKSKPAQMGRRVAIFLFVFFLFLISNLFRCPEDALEKKNPENRQALKGQFKMMVCDTCRACDSEAPRRACDSELQTVLQVNGRANRHLLDVFFDLPLLDLSLPVLLPPDLPYFRCGPIQILQTKKKDDVLLPDLAPLVFFHICNLGLLR